MTAVKGIARWVPAVAVARSYERAWLWPDVRAGIVVTALLIPAGMGYAEVAGLPPVTGLYATIVPLLAYAVFGPSRLPLRWCRDPSPRSWRCRQGAR